MVVWPVRSTPEACRRRQHARLAVTLKLVNIHLDVRQEVAEQLSFCHHLDRGPFPNPSQRNFYKAGARDGNFLRNVWESSLASHGKTKGDRLVREWFWNAFKTLPHMGSPWEGPWDVFGKCRMGVLWEWLWLQDGNSFEAIETAWQDG